MAFVQPALTMQRPRVGIVGTGFIARHFAIELLRRDGAEDGDDLSPRLAGYLTRRHGDPLTSLPLAERATRNVDALLEQSDLILECTGDPLWATLVIEKALAAGIPVMTLNPEFHVTTGSHFADAGYLTEADGDQPGCTASLREEALAMGFKPWVYGNMKGFLNRTPTPEEMKYWGERQGISLPMVTSFTDGTKLQIEQVLVANAFGADLLQEELTGPAGDDLRLLSSSLGEAAKQLGHAVTDYVLSRALPHGVFITATHDDAQAAALAYIKMGDGPFYTLVRPNILVHLEPFKTIRRMQLHNRVLLNNSPTPRLSVAAVAKRDLAAGERIERGCGSFELRGIAVRIADRPGHLPIGLANGLHVRRKVEAGAILGFDDVDLQPHRAIEIWQGIEARALTGAPAPSPSGDSKA